MKLGLKSGVVELADHDSEWIPFATKTIEKLLLIFDLIAKDIQHIGSTAIKGIKAKPLIDIAICVKSFHDLRDVFSLLEEIGVYKSIKQPLTNTILCNLIENSQSDTLMNIFIIEIDSIQWQNHINFRNYLNNFPHKAINYEKLKISLAKQFPNDLNAYSIGKMAFIEECLSEARLYTEMLQKHDIASLDAITKGWSEDKKYCATKANGTKYLLRVSPMSQYETRKILFSIQKQLAALNIPMCKPIAFGICENGVYSIQSWIKGEDFEVVLSSFSESEQYAFGLKAGKILQKIHSIPVPKTNTDGIGAIDWLICEYQKCGLNFVGDDKIISYINHNRHLLENRPQCYLFSDYNVKNMMLENGELIIIDFERFDIGDPWEEFKNIVWSAIASPQFATGQVNGYFDGEPPKEFFKLLSVYIPCLLLSLLSSWAITSDFGRNVTLKLAQDILKWFDNMQNPVPTWYLSGIKY